MGTYKVTGKISYFPANSKKLAEGEKRTRVVLNRGDIVELDLAQVETPLFKNKVVLIASEGGQEQESAKIIKEAKKEAKEIIAAAKAEAEEIIEAAKIASQDGA